MLNSPGDVLYPQLTTSVYWTPVFRGVVSCDIGHLQGCLAWLNPWWSVDFLHSVKCINGKNIRMSASMVKTEADMLRFMAVSTRKEMSSLKLSSLCTITNNSFIGN